VRKLRKRPDLARAAAVDPLQAFEAMGHRIDPALLPTVRRRVRFPVATFDRLEKRTGKNGLRGLPKTAVTMGVDSADVGARPSGDRKRQ
jgi:hypothetical protein